MGLSTDGPTCGIIAKRTPLVDKALELLKRIVFERTGLTVQDVSPDEAEIVLGVDPGIGDEGFHIEGGTESPVCVVGGDERGLLYGVGKFLREARMAPGVFAAGEWRGVSVPDRPVRGMYFATHFHNWYHDAPIEEVTRYVEELALWGCNALSVWFDMHHYTGIDDPAAREMLERLRAILRAAESVGMGAGLTTLANEAYAESPADVRAEYVDGQNGYFAPPRGHYHVEVCPSKPGGLDLILRWREEVLRAFGDIDLRYVWIWPYDQGGCTCADCTPWGANGFLRVAEPVADLARRIFPDARIVLSTWYFDRFVNGEWRAVHDAFSRNRPDWVDYLLIDGFGEFPPFPLEHGVPGGFPVVNFAEISMEGMGPWGGYGANPRPRHWQEHHDRTRALLSGGFPYSEGIYEDLNKVLMLQWGWDPGRDADDIVREYAAGTFGREVAEDVVAAAHMMEEDLGTRARDGEGETTHAIPDLPRAEACRDLLTEADAKLPRGVRENWRWRILMIRAELDAELKRTGGAANARTEELLIELTSIYHAENALPHVHPPVRDWGQIERETI